MKYTIIYIAIAFFLNCSSQKKSDYLEVFYIGPNVSTPISYPCNILSKETLKEELNYKKITDEKTIIKVIKIFDNYKQTNNIDGINARIKVLIHHNNIVDTLCFGEHFNTYKNGIKVKDNIESLKFIKKIIDYENTLPLLVRQHPERYHKKK